MKIAPLCVVSLVAVMQVLSAGAAPGIVIVNATTEPCPIVVSQKPDKIEKRAAGQLASYLKKISGKEFSVQVGPTPIPERAILVGSVAGDLPDSLGREGYIVRTKGQHILVAGLNPNSTTYAVYGFLEYVLGCRWWSHTEEYVPTKTELTVGSVDLTRKPAFALHLSWNLEVSRSKNDFRYKNGSNGPEKFVGGHTLCPYLMPYTKENPHFLPMNKKGERKYNKLHMCYMAKGMPEALATELEKQVKKNKGDVKNKIYFAGMGDWYGGQCLCETCKKVYEEETWTNPDGQKRKGYSGTLIRMINRTAEILEEKYPGIRVGTFAYMSLEAPPAKTKPRANVVIRMPHLRHCIVHAVDKCKKNRRFYLDLQHWLEIAPGSVNIWDYGISFANFLYPFPNIKSMANNIKLYHKIGVRGDEIQGNYVSMGSDMIVLRNYVWGKLFWDPSLDTDKLIEEFCAGYYGPAGPHVVEYVNAIEDSVRKPKMVHMDEFEKKITRKYLTGELRKKLSGIFAKAREATNGEEPYLGRVKQAMVSLESVALWKDGPLKEEGSKLIRADKGDTWERAYDLVKYSRGASPREWGDGRAYRMAFLTYHGGPLAVLKKGDLEIKVSPTLRGRIRRITYKGKNILFVPDFTKKQANNSGGIYENTSPNTRIFEMKGEPTETSMEMEAHLGIRHWGSNTKIFATKKVELTPAGKIKITGTAVLKDKKRDELSVSPKGKYDVGGPVEQVSVEARGSNGVWTAVEIAIGRPPKKKKGVEPRPPNVKGATALRIDLKTKGVTVIDSYIFPAIRAGQVYYEPKTKILVTQLGSEKVKVPRKGKILYLHREIEVRDLK